jgi:plastocyanin domain-containing protein
MKNSYILGIMLVMILVAGGFVLKNVGADKSSVTGNSVGNVVGNVQKIIVGMKDYNYYPNTIKVKANQPVSISLDETVGGCFRAFTIRELGLEKYLQNPSDTLEFTPTQKGSYRFACSMGMGHGTLIVE